VNGAINKASHYFSQGGHAKAGWLGEFQKRDRGAAGVLVSAFGSLEHMLNRGFATYHSEVLSRSSEIAEVLGAYGFYFALATMRHLRAHFRIGPEDDQSIENL
jgi:hypothetical protein